VSQINVNSGPPVDTEERSSRAGFNMLAVVLVLIVAVVVVWLLFAGLFGSGGSTTNVTNVNPPAQTQPGSKDGPNVNINLPKVDVNTPGQQQSAPQPAAPAKP
jgi:hypothetical protein